MVLSAPKTYRRTKKKCVRTQHKIQLWNEEEATNWYSESVAGRRAAPKQSYACKFCECARSYDKFVSFIYCRLGKNRKERMRFADMADTLIWNEIGARKSNKCQPTRNNVYKVIFIVRSGWFEVPRHSTIPNIFARWMTHAGTLSAETKRNRTT